MRRTGATHRPRGVSIEDQGSARPNIAPLTYTILVFLRLKRALTTRVGHPNYADVACIFLALLFDLRIVLNSKVRWFRLCSAVWRECATELDKSAGTMCLARISSFTCCGQARGSRTCLGAGRRKTVIRLPAGRNRVRVSQAAPAVPPRRRGLQCKPLFDNGRWTCAIRRWPHEWRSRGAMPAT